MTLMLAHSSARSIETHVSPSDHPDTHPPGRRCAEPGCITVLCRYNGGPWCYLHAQKHEAEVLCDLDMAA